jgi:hypothetical protein
MKIPDTGKIISVVYIIAGLIVLFLIYKIMSGLGIIKTAKKKAKDKAESEAEEKLRSLPYFDPLYTKKFPDYKPIGEQSHILAKEIRKALRGLGTDEEAIFSVFGKLRSKLNISELALFYKVDYKRDLGTDLMNELTDGEQLTLMEIINKLK